MYDPELRKFYIDTVTPLTAKDHAYHISYFWAWVRLTYNVQKEIYPIPLEWLLNFVQEHLKGRTPKLRAELKRLGFGCWVKKPSVRTILGFISPLSIEHQIRAVSNTCYHPTFRLLARRLKRLAATQRKVFLPITKDILLRLLAACGEDLRGARDRALLLVGFAGGGRHCTDLMQLAVEHLEPVRCGYIATLPIHKTWRFTQQPLTFPIFDRAAILMDRWLDAARIDSGPVFRGVTESGKVHDYLGRGMSWHIVKRVAQDAGLNPALYVSRSLRSGFITEAAREGIPLLDVMYVSGHRQIQSVMTYYREGRIFDNPAAHLSANIKIPRLRAITA